MISSIEWIPVGVADPNPKKYEMSPAELELIQMMQEKGNIEDILQERNEEYAKKSAIKLPKMENNLPPDLRMDEYSSDEDKDEKGVALGQLLVGAPESIAGDMLEDDDSEGKHDDDNHDAGEKSDDRCSDDTDDSDDDLADVPDTREFTPVDVEGLEAMGLSYVGTAAQFDLGVDEDDDESEAEDVMLTADDAIVVVAKTEDDFASLEVQVYDQATGNLYVHHDIPLPSFPLCLASGQVSSNGTTGNFCAVGSFSPGIEIWNLDVLNALEPSCILGGEDTSAADDLMKLQMLNAASSEGAKSKKLSPRHRSAQASGGLRPGSHADAVISLSWNPIHKQVLASGSADSTVKLWDVTQAGTSDYAKCNAATFSHHRDKVQSVVWNPKEGTLLASGSFDRSVALIDARSSGDALNVKSAKIKADCEALAWDPFHPELLTAASEDGTICCWDVRKFETPLWSFVANEYGGVSDLSYNAQVPGMMVTCSIDKNVTIWDTHSSQTANISSTVEDWSPPRPCGQKDMCAGKLYTVSFYPSSPWLLACGGSGNQLSLWDLSSEAAIQKRFRGRIESDYRQSDSEVPDRTGASALSNDKEFQAMMTARDDSGRENGKTSDRKKKKGKGKGKRKAHRKGR